MNTTNAYSKRELSTCYDQCLEDIPEGMKRYKVGSWTYETSEMLNIAYYNFNGVSLGDSCELYIQKVKLMETNKKYCINFVQYLL